MTISFLVGTVFYLIGLVWLAKTKELSRESWTQTTILTMIFIGLSLMSVSTISDHMEDVLEDNAASAIVEEFK